MSAFPQVNAPTREVHMPASGFDSRHLHPEVFVDCASTLRRLHEARPLLGSGLVVCPPLTALVSGEVTAGLVFVDAPDFEPCDLARRSRGGATAGRSAAACGPLVVRRAPSLPG